MIRCDTEKERKALAELVWAVKEVLVTQKVRNPAVKDMEVAFHKLFRVGELEL